MENLLELKKFRSIDLIVLSKCPWLNPLQRDIDTDGKTSFASLAKIIAGPDDEILGRIEETYALIDKDCNGRVLYVNVKGKTYAAAMTEVIWGRMIVIAYYFYHHHPIWRNLGLFDKMQMMLNNSSIIKAVPECFVIIDRRNNEDNVFQLGLTKQPTTNPAASQYSPDMMRAMVEINNGDKHVNDINWRKELEYMGEFWKLMPEKTPIILWLWGLLGIVKNPTTRLEVIKELEGARLSYTGTGNDSTELFVALFALRVINEKIVDYNKKQKPAYVKSPWPLEDTQPNGLAHILADELVTGQDLVAIAEEIRLAEIKKRTETILGPILKAFFYNRAFNNNEITKFISYIYKAEGYRQIFLCGKIELEKLPEAITLNRKIRNKCFDIYIEKKLAILKDKLDKDDSLVVDPTELEYYQRLLEDEKKAVKRAEEKQGSLYPGREMILEMANMFLKYLEIKIAKLQEMSNIQELLTAKTVNVAMGDNVMNKYENSDE